MGTPLRERPRLTTGFSLTRSHGTLADNFSGRNNGIGAIRLALAMAVVASHSRPLGFAQEDLGHWMFGTQTNVGNLAVYGFFVLSGLLITRSARRTAIGRYAWHRILRILPGLWVCLLVSAFVLSPLVMLREHGNLSGFWSGPEGPIQYVWANWWSGLRQPGVHDLFAHTTPYGRFLGGRSVYDGAIWSLAYEMLCYVMVGILAFTGVLRHARRFLFAIAAALFVVIVSDWHAGVVVGPSVDVQASVTMPLLGIVYFKWMSYLGFLFVLGAIFDTYADRVPIHDGLGLLSAAVFAGSLLGGAFYVVGFPAFAYLLVWLGVRMPKQLHWIGRKNDYSYGIYIYGFVAQQLFASLGWYRWGFVPFVAMSMVAAVGLGYLSWHLVEKHAMSLKGWSPRLPRAVAGRLPAVVTGRLPGGWLPDASPETVAAAQAAAAASAASDSADPPADSVSARSADQTADPAGDSATSRSAAGATTGQAPGSPTTPALASADHH